MAFAFGGAEGLCSTEIDEIWMFATAALDMELPLVAAEDNVAIAVNGYRITVEVVPGPDIVERYLLIKDPYVGSYQMPLDLLDVNCVWRPPEFAIGLFQEAELELDPDGDGIVTFDEVRRFHTDPMQADSDSDGLNDKEDVAGSIFDPEQGYAAEFDFIGDELFPLGSSSRDRDRDGLKNERDCDSDNDGIKDGDDADSFSVDIGMFGPQPDNGVCDEITETLAPRGGDSSFTVGLCTERADLDPDLLQCLVTFSVSMDYAVAMGDGSRAISCFGVSQGDDFVFSALGGGVAVDILSSNPAVLHFPLDGLATVSPTGLAYFDESGNPVFSNPLTVECRLLGPFNFENQGLLDTVEFEVDLIPDVVEADDCFPSAHPDCGVP